MSSAPEAEAPGGYSHIVASRDGVFLVARSRYRKLLDGGFFGLTLAGGRVYAFEATGPRGADNGRVVSFILEEDGAVDLRVEVAGLDAGCHQIDVFQDALFLVDTDNQRVIEVDARGRRHVHHPIAPARISDGWPAFRHLNSFLGHDDTIFLMLHNRGHAASELLEVDRGFRVRARMDLPGTKCHDVVRTEAGGLIMCDSEGGRLIDATGPLAKVDELMTRGLSVGRDEIAVGSSLFGARPVRNLIPGFVTFLDRDYRRTARLHVPAAPTQIRRLDGADLSLSSPRDWP